MKIWKKLSLLLCACFAFSSVATSCDMFGSDGDSSSSSSSSSTKDSSSTGTDDSSVEEEDNTSEIIDVYMGMITRTLEKSQSAKLTFALETTTTASATDGASTVGGWTNYLLEGEAIVAKTEEGFDAKITVQLPDKEAPGKTEARAYYYIDGYLYAYNVEDQTYEKSSETLEETLENLVHSSTGGEYTLETLLGSLAGGAGGILGGDMSDLSYDKLEEAFSEYGVMESEITSTGMKITADASEEADELFDFLRTVDKDTTYGELLDYPLSQIDPDLDSDAIIDELFMSRNDTVADLIEKFDKKSKEETGKSLQENIDEILKNEMVGSILDSLGEEVAPLVKNFKVQDIVDEYGELSMDDLTAEIVNQLADVLVEAGVNLEEIGFDTSNATFSMLITVLETVLKMPAFKNIPEDSEFYELLEKAQALEVSKSDMEFELKVNKASIESFNILGNFGGKATDDGVTATVGGTLEVVISEFNTEKMTISLPEGAEVVVVYNECKECGEKKESVSYREEELGYYCDECVALLPEVPEE